MAGTPIQVYWPPLTFTQPEDPTWLLAAPISVRPPEGPKSQREGPDEGWLLEALR